MTLTLPTTTGPNGRVLPDWTHAPGGAAPAVWKLAPDQPGGGAVRVVVPGGGEATTKAAPASQRPASSRPLPARRRACLSLGPKAKPDCACTDRVCLAGRGVVRHVDACQSCADYQPV